MTLRTQLLFLGGALLAAAILAQPTCDEWLPVENGRSGPFSGLGDVAALSAADVWAVGGQFTLHWNGSVWTQVEPPSGLGQGFGWDLRSVGASGPGEAWFGGLVGISPFHADVLMVRREGDAWGRVDTIHLREQEVWPYSPRNGSPAAIDAVSPDDVWAVGVAAGFSPDTTNVGLAVHWDGSEWTEIDVPAVTDDIHWLEDVAAIATDDVWAVGWGRDVVSTDRALTYHWDGSQWNEAPRNRDREPPWGRGRTLPPRRRI